ncbi:MAG TPA: flagellar biosynthetic protein FliO [Planctomycetaceae bacterium]
MKIDGSLTRSEAGAGCKADSGCRRAFKLAAVASLLLAGLAQRCTAAERAAQVIPPPSSDRPQAKEPKTPGNNKGKPSNGSLNKPATTSWGTTLGGLIAVLALIYLTAKVLRKSMPAAHRTLPVEVVQVLGRKPLDYRHSIHLIRCGSRLLVVGASQEGLTTLCEMTDPVEIDYLAGLCKPSEPTSVADTFNQLFRRFQTPAVAESAADPETRSSPDPAALRLQERLQQSTRRESDERDDEDSHDVPPRESAA